METFGKGWRKGRETSATVNPVGRFAVVLGALALLICGGLASAILAAAPGPVGATTTSATTTGATTPTLTSTAPSVLAFTGHGWGHGLGMSQWGAYGYAKHGWTYDRILGHYYPATILGPAPVATVRVLLAQETKATLSSDGPWTVTAGGAKTRLDPGPLALGAKLAIGGKAAGGPLTFASKRPISIDGHPYRGTVVVQTDGKLLTLVDKVGLEAYVKGVVPAEMPSNWAPEAVKAQAVAARSYALANVAKGRPFDLYGDTRSQVYGGVAVETPASNAAVDATKGQVVLYNGKVADTLFFSTSGGRTASALESTGIAVPYLISVVDPYDTLSPYHDWGPVLLDARAVAKQLKLAAAITDVAVTNGASARAKSVVFTAADETQAKISGNQARAFFGLRSTWFAPALLSLAPAAKSMTYGGATSLGGVVRGADGVTIESRPASGGAWTSAASVTAGSDGSFALLVKPQVSTWYRLAWGDARAGLAKIAVAARVTATASVSGIQGTVRPVVAGAPVELQLKQPDATWATVSSTATDAAASWSFSGSLAAGTYRVRVSPGHGVAAGVSTPVTVP
jgi:stage II sporulation protein D